MSPLPLIEKINFGKSSFKYSDKENNNLFFLYSSFILLFFVFLAIRLFHLTIVKGNYYRRLSDENRIRRVVIEPKRGDILDRNGIVLATSISGNTEDKKDRIASKRIYNVEE